MKSLNNHPLIEYYIEYNNFGRLLNMDFNIRSAGLVEYNIEIDDCHLATPIAAHGGVVAALLDASLGVCALSAVLKMDHVVSTVELKFSFLGPVLKGDKLKAVSEIVKQGKKLLFVEGEVFNQKNELIASASGTFNSYPASKIGYSAGKLQTNN